MSEPRPMAQNYDPATGVALMGACDPSCRYPCTPICPLDSDRYVNAVFGPPGLEFDLSDSWSAFTCHCDRTDQHAASDCRAHDGLPDLTPTTQAPHEAPAASAAGHEEDAHG